MSHFEAEIPESSVQVIGRCKVWIMDTRIAVGLFSRVHKHLEVY